MPINSRSRSICAFASLALLALSSLIHSRVRADQAGNIGAGNHAGSVTVRTRSELIQAVQSARPGTQVLVAPGTYQAGLSFRGLRGEPDRPIVIAALDPRNPPVFQGGGSGMQLSSPEHVELRDLVIIESTGNGLNIDDGGDVESPAAHLLLRGLQIRDIGPRGNRDGLKLSGVDHFVIDHCVIERWGDAGSAIDMVGCHDGRIIDCQFKFRSDVAANGVQTKGGSARIVVQRCRFEDAGNRSVNIGGSTGKPYFRPRGAEHEARDITVEDCVFIGSMAPIAFVGVDGATVRYNTIYRPTTYVLRILQESQGPEFIRCRNGTFANNLIVFNTSQVRSIVNVGGGTEPDSFTFSGNHWYCQHSPTRSRPAGLPVAESDGTYGVAPTFVNESERDLRLSDDSPVRNVGVRKTKNQ